MQSRNEIGCIWYVLAGLLLVAYAVYSSLKGLQP